MLNPTHMILGFLSRSLSTGRKLLGVESGSNSPDLPTQLLLDATLLKKASYNTAFLVACDWFKFLSVLDVSNAG